MSMLTQANDLRLMARLLREYDSTEIRRMLYEAADTIDSLQDSLFNEVASRKAETQIETSRWFELFGTPERAARTMQNSTLICHECLIHEQCAETPEESNCMILHYDALLEYLRGDAE